jgi:hypothetical protein
LLAALAACSEGEDARRAELASLVALAAPHQGIVSRFDRWAHRVASAEAVWANRDALEETAFTPVRHEPGVVSAWIRRGTHEPLAFPRATALPELALRRVRVEGLGDVEVGRGTIVRGEESIEVVIIAMERDGLRTTIAIEPER